MLSATFFALSTPAIFFWIAGFFINIFGGFERNYYLCLSKNGIILFGLVAQLVRATDS